MYQKLITSRYSWVVALSLCVSTTEIGAAESYPSRPIRLVVNTGVGGVTDLLARFVADKLKNALGQTFVVDNRAGASGIIGAEIVARAAPDGYTLLVVFPSFTINPSLFKKLPYDTVNDFVPITDIGASVSVLLVDASFPAKSVKQLISIARDRPGQLNYGSVGAGSLAYFAAEQMASLAKMEVVHVAYKSAPQTLTALVSGEIQFYFNSAITAIPQIRAAQVHALGVTSKTRLAALPQVPTIAEAGIAGYDVVGTNGILAPAKTPPAIINRLYEESAKVLRSREVVELFVTKGVEVGGRPPEEYRAMIKAEIEKWAKLMK